MDAGFIIAIDQPAVTTEQGHQHVHTTNTAATRSDKSQPNLEPTATRETFNMYQVPGI